MATAAVAAATAATPPPQQHQCDHCGRVSSSLLRCAKCKSVWYCNRTCQSLAWNPTNNGGDVDGDRGGGDVVREEGHRKVCRRLRKLAATTSANVKSSSSTAPKAAETAMMSPSASPASSSASTMLAAGGNTKDHNALSELMQHVQTMDCNEAYKRMCLAQDEIQRLQRQLSDAEREQKEEIETQQEIMSDADGALLFDRDADANNATDAERTNDGMSNDTGACDSNENETAKVAPHSNENNNENANKCIQTAAKIDKINRNTPQSKKKIIRASGSWLEQGGKCSIEYLSNVRCYQITLTTNAGESDSLLSIPRSRDELYVAMVPIDNGQFTSSSSSSLVGYHEMKLYLSNYDTNHTSTLPSAVTRDPEQLPEQHVLLLYITLPTATNIQSNNNHQQHHQYLHPTARTSTDANSISIRIQLSQNEMSGSILDGITENLLGLDDEGLPSSFSSILTEASRLNLLCCRSCQNPIIVNQSSLSSGNDASAASFSNGKSNTNANSDSDGAMLIVGGDNHRIHTVLPLPTGYWDDISDYLICYDGQANVDFSTSATNAIKGMALEDDAVLVLHQSDLDVKGGVCDAGGGKGYGEHSMAVMQGNLNDAANTSIRNQAWRDKAAAKEESGSKTVTCASCFATLGFASHHDSNTYRLYKHLLDCREKIASSSNTIPSTTTAFAKKHTISSFLSREMVRYAESDAVYTFIVGVSDMNDWTRVHSPGSFILLRMLSWDCPMVTLGGGGDSTIEAANDDAGSVKDVIHGNDCHLPNFQKVVKVIFEETSASDLSNINKNNDNGSFEWTWRGADFCCPPRTAAEVAVSGNDAENNLGPTSIQGMNQNRKTSSIRIFLSEQEWYELRDGLVQGSQYFSETVRDAVVGMKLGSIPATRANLVGSDNKEHINNVSLSFLPLVA